MTFPIKKGRYSHYKTKNIYEVLGEARHSETLEIMVIYLAHYDCEKFGPAQIWVRPKTMFTETVEYKGESIPRFQYIDD